MFTGEYHVAVDDKGRLAIPVRTEFDAGAYLSRWIDPCLALHPRVAWGGRCVPRGAASRHRRGARLFRHFLFPSAWPIGEQDKQGRLVIPAKLREAAGLTGDKAVLIGAGSHLGLLWSPERWEELSARMAQPGFLEGQFKGLGI